jgi:tryptophan synthase alpha subunit
VIDPSTKTGDYGFGIDKEKVVAVLRKVADEVDCGKILVNEFSHTLTAGTDDYRTDAITIKFVARKED